jgi:hypothetical protein
MRRLLCFLTTAVVLLTTWNHSVVLCAQTAATGALSGTLKDQAGAVVVDAQIRVTNLATLESRTTVSTMAGSYTVPLLAPGEYRVEVSKSGFKRAEFEKVEVNVSETKGLNVELQVGMPRETVTVHAVSETLQTESSALGRIVDEQLVHDLPLDTRNYTQIVTLSPGIAADVTNATDFGLGGLSQSQGNFRANGAQGLDNNFQMNGVPINDLQASGANSGGVAVPNPDAIQEFKVQTGLYDAAYGRNAGANVDVVTKSGTNNFHGTAFEFFRNEALDANEFFTKMAGEPRGALRQNQFGGAFGGPIRKSKLLFFLSYQGTRQLNGIVSPGGAKTATLPKLTDDRSAAGLGAIFGGQADQLGTLVAADGSNISAPALAIMQWKLPNGQFAIPTPPASSPCVPTAAGPRCTTIYSIPATFDEDQFVANLDFLHSAKSTLVGKVFFADSDSRLPLPEGVFANPVPGSPQVTTTNFRNFSLTHTYTFSSRLLNQATVSYYRIFSPNSTKTPFNWSDVGVTASPQDNGIPGLLIYDGPITTSATIGAIQGSKFVQNHYPFQDVLIYIRGKQTLRFGGGFTPSSLSYEDIHNTAGMVYFDAFNGGLGSWPSFLIGAPGDLFLEQTMPGLTDRQFHVFDANAFAQDDVKVTQTLTVNLGLRYERLGDFADALGRNSNFDLSEANPNPPAAGSCAGYVVASNFSGSLTPSECPSGAVVKSGNKFALRGIGQNTVGPRMGFAWRLPHPSRMALRGGYGIYYSRATGQDAYQQISLPPFSQSVVNFFPPGSITNPFPPEPAFPVFVPYSLNSRLSAVTLAQNFRPPITQQYGLNLQTDMGHNTMLEVGYVGTRGTHQIAQDLPNQALSASATDPIRGETTNTVANVPLRVPIEGISTSAFRQVISGASSWYNGLQTNLSTRMTKGLQLSVSYTFAHAYNTKADDTGAAASGAQVVGNQNDVHSTYGRSDFNRSQRLIASYLYEVPIPKTLGTIANGFLGGWAISGVITIQSGLPLTLTGSNGNNAFGIPYDTIQFAPGCNAKTVVTHGSVESRLNNYLNTACVAPWPIIGSDGVATGFGNSGIGIVFGPGQNNSDMAIIKRTSVRGLGENGNIEFRAEFFNAFNHAQFGNPGTDTSGGFGVISGPTAVNPRIIQFALKLNF